MPETSGKKLMAMIAARKKFLRQAVDFALSILESEGTILYHDLGTYHTHMKTELKDFRGFSFLSDTGQSIMGGNTIQIWYRAGLKKKLVLDVYWLSGAFCLAECEVPVFDKDLRWERALKRLIANHRKVSVRSAREHLKELRGNKKRKHKERLMKEAERLCIRPLHPDFSAE